MVSWKGCIAFMVEGLTLHLHQFGTIKSRISMIIIILFIKLRAQEGSRGIFRRKDPQPFLFNKKRLHCTGSFYKCETHENSDYFIIAKRGENERNRTNRRICSVLIKLGLRYRCLTGPCCIETLSKMVNIFVTESEYRYSSPRCMNRMFLFIIYKIHTHIGYSV